MKFKYLLLFLILSSCLYSQKNSNNWIFGDRAWIYFPDETSDPYLVGESAMNQVEGCATYSDDNGNLLFYTDGSTVWNNKHEIIENGTELGGSWTAAQGAIIFPKPGVSKKLYIICLGSTERKDEHAYYSIIDYSKGYDKAELINKNTILNDSYDGERATVIKKPNENGYWLILDDVNFPKYLIYDVNSSGINLKSTYSGNMVKKDNHGVVKISPNSNLIISVNSDRPEFELCHFNPFTGSIYKSMIIKSNDLGNNVQGADFSPNSKFVYIDGNQKTSFNWTTILNQFDIIKYFKTQVPEFGNIVRETFKWRIASNEAIELAPNNKIYIASPETNYISCIHSPDTKYPNCNYVKQAVDLKETKSMLGLPSQIVYPQIDYIFVDTLICEESSFDYDRFHDDSFYWISPYDSVIENSYLKINNFNVLDTGYYHLYDNDNNLVEILRIQDIKSQNTNFVSLKDEEYACEGDSILVSTNEFVDKIIWESGSTNKNIYLTESGNYNYKVFLKNGCVFNDSVSVNFLPLPNPNIVGENTYPNCDSIPVKLESEFDHFGYKWINSKGILISEDKSALVSESDNYRLVATNEYGCTDTSEYFSVDINRDSNFLEINYSLNNPLEIESTIIGSLVCKTVEIRNKSNKDVIIDKINIKDKLNFSIPPSSLPLTIEAKNVKTLDICFYSDSSGNFEDILEIDDNCSPHFLKLISNVETQKINFLSSCNVEWSLNPIQLNNNFTFRHSLPYPNPNKNAKISVDYIKFKTIMDKNISVSIYDSKGTLIEKFDKILTSENTYSNGVLEKGTFINKSHLNNGIYFILVNEDGQTNTFPLIIVN